MLLVIKTIFRIGEDYVPIHSTYRVPDDLRDQVQELAHLGFRFWMTTRHNSTTVEMLIPGYEVRESISQFEEEAFRGALKIWDQLPNKEDILLVAKLRLAHVS
jgi:hypothetical protein